MNILSKNVVFLHLLSQRHNAFLKEKITRKRRKFYKWALHYFFDFLLFSNVSWITNMRPYGCWKMCYIFCIHWFYPICFTELLDQNELWVSKCCHAHFKTFYLWLWLTNNAIKISSYCTLWYLLYITFFGEIWLTHSAFTPMAYSSTCNNAWRWWIF